MDAAADYRERLEAWIAMHKVSLRDVAPTSIEIAGAVAGRGRDGWWVNQCVGLGIDRPVTGDDLQKLLQFYAEEPASPEIVVCDAAHESTAREVSRAGLAVHSVEINMAADLHADWPAVEADVREVDLSDPDALDESITVMEQGFNSDDGHVVPDIEREEWQHARTRSCNQVFAACVEGEMAGIGCLLIPAQVPGKPWPAMLFGGGVRPGFRRRGLHRDLFLARLHAAKAAGCDFAVTEGDGDGPTVRNARRLGMTHFCTNVHFKPPADDATAGREAAATPARDG